MSFVATIFHSVKRHYSLILMLCIICFAIILRLLTYYLNPILSRDSIGYIFEIQDWYHGKNINVLFPAPDSYGSPLLPSFLVKLFLPLGIKAEYIGLTLNILFGSLSCIWLYLLVKEYFRDKNIALGAMFVLAVTPSLVVNSAQVQRDAIAFFMYGGTIYYLFKGYKEFDILSWIISGGFLVCSLLSRYESIELLIISLLLIVDVVLTGKICWHKKTVIIVCWLVTIISMTLLLGSGIGGCNFYQKIYLNRVTNMTIRI